MAGPNRASSSSAGAAGAGAPPRGGRTSALAQLAATLPSVDRALDEVIARAHQVDPGPAPGAAPSAVIAPPRVEHRDATSSQRWRAAEAQLRDAEAREHALRDQLDRLHRRAASTEAVALVAPPMTRFPARAVAIAFLGGLAVMFGGARLLPDRDTPAAQRTDVAPAFAPAAGPSGADLPTAPARPMVTPIDPPVPPPAPAVPTASAAPTAAAVPTTAAPTTAAPAATPNRGDPPPGDDARPRGPRAGAHAPPLPGEIIDPFAEPGGARAAGETEAAERAPRPTAPAPRAPRPTAPAAPRPGATKHTEPTHAGEIVDPFR